MPQRGQVLDVRATVICAYSSEFRVHLNFNPKSLDKNVCKADMSFSDNIYKWRSNWWKKFCFTWPFIFSFCRAKSSKDSYSVATSRKCRISIDIEQHPSFLYWVENLELHDIYHELLSFCLLISDLVCCSSRLNCVLLIDTLGDQ